MGKAFEDSEHTNQWIKKQLHYSTKRSGWNVRSCAKIEEKKSKQQSFKQSLIVEDAKLRQEIHVLIREMKEPGKSKLEVIFALSKRPEFKKYSSYFKVWVENDYKEYKRKAPWARRTTIPKEKVEEEER